MPTPNIYIYTTILPLGVSKIILMFLKELLS